MLSPNGNCTFNNGGGLIAPYISICYKSVTFCDLVLIACGNERVPCHKLVMCSLSQRLLSLCSSAREMEDTTYIHLPQFTHQEVESVVDRIYGFLDQGKVEIPCDEVTAVLGIQTSPLKLKDASNRHDIYHSGKSRKADLGDDSDVAKVENGGSDNWKIECDPDPSKPSFTLRVKLVLLGSISKESRIRSVVFFRASLYENSTPNPPSIG